MSCCGDESLEIDADVIQIMKRENMKWRFTEIE